MGLVSKLGRLSGQIRFTKEEERLFLFVARWNKEAWAFQFGGGGGRKARSLHYSLGNGSAF